MARRIAHAWFQCPTCGHRSTPPETINTMPEQMETYQIIEPIVTKTKDELEQEIIKLDPIFTDAKEITDYKSDIEAFHAGNAVTIETTGNNFTVVKMARSHSKVEFTGMFIEEANSITLKCPECDTVLCEAKW